MSSAHPNLSETDVKIHVVPEKQPYCVLSAADAFALLSDSEKKYAAAMYTASWRGALSCLVTKSPFAPRIFLFVLRTFEKPEARELAASTPAGKAVLNYSAVFLGNMGEFQSFGDTKIAPGVARNAFRSVVAEIEEKKLFDASRTESLVSEFDALADHIYALGPEDRSIGYLGSGVNGYYGPGVTREDVAAVQQIAVENDISVLNTRLFLASAGAADGKRSLELRVASASADASRNALHGRVFESGDGSVSVTVRCGDQAAMMRAVVDGILAAKEHCSGDRQAAMLTHYAEHFESGAHGPYVESQKEWVRDIGPAVETNIGFVETYLDPSGQRAEFEGLVSCVDKDMSSKFNELVSSAEPLIAELPWPRFMEKETFLKPDFTSLVVLAFANCGVPAGINIPNLEEVRATFGFKNVSLQNVLAARVPEERATFLTDADQALFRALQPSSFAVQVGIHELLGHGSGRLLTEDADGKRNFDPTTSVDPTTGTNVASWYKPGESWESVFTDIASSYEECRAECVGVYLCTDRKILGIFGHNDDTAAMDVAYINWLNMCRAGLVALEQYDPVAQRWGQAHMRARFAILQVLLRDGKGCVSVVDNNDGIDGVTVSIDRDRLNDAKEAIKAFLVKIQTFKSTANGAAGREMYESLTAVDGVWIERRKVVLSRKKPRGVFVQGHIETGASGDATFKEFEASASGVIESFLSRFPGKMADDMLQGF